MIGWLVSVTIPVKTTTGRNFETGTALSKGIFPLPHTPCLQTEMFCPQSTLSFLFCTTCHPLQVKHKFFTPARVGGGGGLWGNRPPKNLLRIQNIFHTKIIQKSYKNHTKIALLIVFSIFDPPPAIFNMLPVLGPC